MLGKGVASVSVRERAAEDGVAFTANKYDECYNARATGRTETRIEPLRQRVESWRKNKAGNEKMPATLWEGAIELAKVYGVSPVQRILRIDYRGLERRALGIRKPAGKARAAPRRASEFYRVAILAGATGRTSGGVGRWHGP